MKTSELTGALLDYWVARAEGVTADRLTVKPIPMPENRHLTVDGLICMMDFFDLVGYSTDWVQGGPLIDKVYGVEAHCRNGNLNDIYWQSPPGSDVEDPSIGDTPLQAICRAVVRAAFGDEVGEVSEC